MRLPHILLLASMFTFISCAQVSASKQQAPTFNLEYQVSFLPEDDRADVTIQLTNNDDVTFIDFNTKRAPCKNFTSSSKLKKKKGRLIWYPHSGNARISYQCKITHKREKQKGRASYDALMTKDWAIFRGDDLVPPARVRANKGWSSKARIRFTLPKTWPSINAEWERDLSKNSESNSAAFIINNPDRRFDRPTGWMIAGKIATRRAKLVDGEHTFRMATSAPLDTQFRRMNVLTFMQFIWPEFKNAFKVKPKKILVVSAGDPMWRGGLSAGNSFYMHEDRPIISENGTSTLVHEMFHMLTGIRGQKGHDWIAEGLAEYYSLNLIKRAGGMDEDRYQRSLNKLRDWSKDVKTLYGKHSKGKTTAAATLLFDELNREILKLTNNKSNLDDLVVSLIPQKKIDLPGLQEAFLTLTQSESTTLRSDLLAKK